MRQWRYSELIALDSHLYGNDNEWVGGPMITEYANHGKTPFPRTMAWMKEVEQYMVQSPRREFTRG
jgi:hypothetical protein